ncbi:hypothetical protein [Aeromonas salmonicida]|uniref:hypothetical protein n=1 Tax=Aeromonas salmonicida TaxID=645 RepID=UPI001396A55A|nr:hypothetical protein [Aeromonas salmonicida]
MRSPCEGDHCSASLRIPASRYLQVEGIEQAAIAVAIQRAQVGLFQQYGQLRQQFS